MTYQKMEIIKWSKVEVSFEGPENTRGQEFA